MMTTSPRIPPCACLLADHLDCVLATGEDLLKVRSARPPASNDAIECILSARQAQGQAIERIRALEANLVARVLTARDRAAELARVDSRFKTIARLFASGTSVVADAAAACSDSSASDFASGEGLTSYLNSRGMLPDNTACLPENADVIVDERLLLMGRVTLGVLMDLAASFLDALETHFELYESGDPDHDLTEANYNAPLPEARGSAKLDSLIETTLQVMFEPRAVKDDRGWAPGSLIAALSQIDAEAEPQSPAAA